MQVKEGGDEVEELGPVAFEEAAEVVCAFFECPGEVEFPALEEREGAELAEDEGIRVRELSLVELEVVLADLDVQRFRVRERVFQPGKLREERAEEEPCPELDGGCVFEVFRETLQMLAKQGLEESSERLRPQLSDLEQIRNELARPELALAQPVHVRDAQECEERLRAFQRVNERERDHLLRLLLLHESVRLLELHFGAG